MSTVVILAPVIIGSLPIIAAAAATAAANLGLTVAREIKETNANLENMVDNSVEIELEHGQAVAENMAAGEEMVMSRNGMTIRISRDNRGRCKVCAEGDGYSKVELKAAAQQFTEKFTQSFAYHRTVTELKRKNFQMVDEHVEEDGSIKIHVRRWVD